MTNSNSDTGAAKTDPVELSNSSEEGVGDDHIRDVGVEQKILLTINSGFPKSLRNKVTRLFLFIINFGSHLITFNEAGNVLIQNHVIDATSNIIDLLRACVSVSDNMKPAGYSVFVTALRQINVPRHFLSGSTNLSDDSKRPQKIDRTKEKSRTKRKWQPY